MNAKQIRAEVIEVLARSRYERVRIASNSPSMPPWSDRPGEPYDIGGVTAVQVGSFDPRRRYRVQAAQDVDALAAAGLLPVETIRRERVALGSGDEYLVQQHRTEWRAVNE